MAWETSIISIDNCSFSIKWRKLDSTKKLLIFKIHDV